MQKTLAEVKGCPQKDRTESEGYVGAQTVMWICEDNIVEVPFDKEHLLERILSPENLLNAYKAILRNKGCGGIDKMSCEQMLPWRRRADALPVRRSRHGRRRLRLRGHRGSWHSRRHGAAVAVAARPSWSLARLSPALPLLSPVQLPSMLARLSPALPLLVAARAPLPAVCRHGTSKSLPSGCFHAKGTGEKSFLRILFLTKDN